MRGADGVWSPCLSRYWQRRWRKGHRLVDREDRQPEDLREGGWHIRSILARQGGGSLLLVSQFTLYGDCTRGRRPSFSDAMPSAEAKVLFEAFVERARLRVPDVQAGVFQAHMEVTLTNDGPVTLIIDSRKQTG